MNPELVLFEDEDAVAYLTENAATMAHIVITTKEPYPNIEQTPDYLVAWCFAIANKFSRLLLESLNIQGLNLLVEVGEGAGQQVDQFTINVLPRVQNDNLPLTWTPTQGDQKELLEHMELYKKATDKKWIFEDKQGPSKSPGDKQEEVIKQEDGKENYQIKQLHRLP